MVLFADICGKWNGHGAYPWLALMYSQDDTLVGMGTIIARRWVILEGTGIEWVYLPTYLSTTYLPTYIPTYVLPTYLHTYRIPTTYQLT